MRRAASLVRLLAAAGVALVLLAAGACRDSDRPELTIAAAADLRFAFEELAPAFEERCGCRVVLMFGSSGTFATQIQAGLPADLYFSANMAYVDTLEARGLILPETKQLYAVGRIVLAVQRGSDLSVGGLADLQDPAIGPVAIANPEHAPYGVAAKEALEAAGLWQQVRPRLVLGENAAQAAEFVQTGNAPVGIIPLSLAVRLQANLTYVLIDESLHRPLRQGAAVLRGARRADLAAAFLAFVNGEQGRPVMKKYGFVLPGEE